jgi:hypothetical protein
MRKAESPQSIKIPVISKREAEEIAAISDSLLVPDKVEQRLEKLRKIFRRGEPE